MIAMRSIKRCNISARFEIRAQLAGFGTRPALQIQTYIFVPRPIGGSAKVDRVRDACEARARCYCRHRAIGTPPGYQRRAVPPATN